MSRFYYRDPSAPRPNLPRGLGALALIEHEGRVLMDCRADTGEWGLVGGHVEEDETLSAAMIREVFEETGLTVISYDFFGVFSDPSRIIRYSDGNVRAIVSMVFRSVVEDPAALRISEESRELRWVTRDELRMLSIVATARPIVDAYLSGRTQVLA